MKCNPRSLNGDVMSELDQYHRARARQCLTISRGFYTRAMRAYWQNLAQFYIRCALDSYIEQRVSK